MAELLKLIPVCGRSRNVLYYIERKKGDNRPSNVIVSEYKLNLKNSEIQRKQREKELKLYK